MNESCNLPIELNPINFLHLLKIMEITPKHTSDFLTLNIEIPTSFLTTFQLIEAISTPIIYENMTYEIKPNLNMYLVHRNGYVNMFSIPFTLEDKIKCVDLTMHKLCFPKNSLQITEIFSVKKLFLPDYDFCNSKDNKTVEKILKLDKKCNLIQVSNFNKIISLTKVKFYVFIVTPTILNINCAGKEQTKAFNSSVIITDLDTKCSLKIEQSFNRDIENILINKQINLKPINSVNTNDLASKEPRQYFFKHTRDLQSDFTDIIEQANSLQNEDNSTEIEKPKRNLYNGNISYWYLTWVLTIFVSIFSLMKLLAWCEERQIYIHNIFYYLYYCLCARRPPTNI